MLDNADVLEQKKEEKGNEKVLDELKRTKLLIVDRRTINLGGHKRKEDNTIKSLSADIDEVLQDSYLHYPRDRFYLETANTFDDAISAARQTLFDFFILYKLEYENKKDASGLIKALLQITGESDAKPFYFVAYRSMDTFTEDSFHMADTNFKRYSALHYEEDCISPVERMIVKCKEYALADRLNHVVFVGEVGSETMISLMAKLSAERTRFNGIKCIAYENSEFLELKEEKKKGAFSFLKH